MPELTLLLGLLFIAGSFGCEGPRQEAPLDNLTVNAGHDPKNHRRRELLGSTKTLLGPPRLSLERKASTP